MPRYRIFGGLDDVPVEDGDVGFSGMNLRLPVWQLAAGMLSMSANGRIDGAWTPRRGVEVLTEGSLSEGTPLRLPFWLIDANSGAAEGSQGLAVTAAERDGELVTLTVVGHGLPVGGGSAASAVVNPAGANNSVRYDAVAVGEGGAAITIRYSDPVEGQTSTLVASDANQLLVAPGSKAQMVISGVITGGVNGSLLYSGESNGFPDWSGPTSGINWFAGNWTIQSALYLAFVESSNPTPEGLTDWTIVQGNGQPTVTAAASSAQQVIDAVNADPVASLLVTASASGTVTGAVAAVGPVHLSGGANSGGAYLGLEGITGSPAVDPNGAWLMNPTDANTLEFTIENAAVGMESYTVTTARVLSELDDFASGDVLGSCLFSDPSSENDESIFLAYGFEVKKVKLSDGSISTIGLPGSETLDGEINMIQAMDKVLIFRAGKVGMEWSAGDTDFALVASGTYTQPQIFTVTGTFVDVVSGACTITGLTNNTVALGSTVLIHGSTDPHFSEFVGKSYYVTAANGASFSFYIPVEDISTIGSNTLSIGRRVSIGGGFILQPGFPWAIYFQRRIWGPYWYRWDTALTPDAFSDRNIRDELVAGDILDTDTFDPITNQFRITGGVADYIVALHPFFDDTLLVFNRNSIHAVSGTIGSLADASVRELTREVGCLARKSVITQGNTVFFLSDNGVYGLEFQDLYNLRGMDKPLSENIQPFIDRISQNLASGAVAAYHNNRYWLAVPLDSSPRAGDAPGNNAILVFNLLNREWESVDTFGDANFLINDLIIGSAGSRNELYAITSAGGVHSLDKLDADYDQLAANAATGYEQFPIDAELQTRGYVCGTVERKRFTELAVQFKSGSAQSDIGMTFVTDDPDNAGGEELASKSISGPLESGNTADIRQRVGGLRGFNGIVTIRRVIGRPLVRGVKVAATVTNRATISQK